jgi:hypothetical protein
MQLQKRERKVERMPPKKDSRAVELMFEPSSDVVSDSEEPMADVSKLGHVGFPAFLTRFADYEHEYQRPDIS